jgi:hypothetical protein
MEFNHGVSGIDQIRSVHLDFVVVLSTYPGCREDDRQQPEQEDATVREAKPESTAKR